MISKSIVIDTNLIFSALLSKSSKIRDIIFEDKNTLISPNFLITEIYKHKNKLIKLSNLDESEFYLYFNEIIENIQFLPINFISLESKEKAYALCKDIDIKNTPFVALSIELNSPIWTGDKKLKEGLISKGFNNFFTYP